MPAVLRTVTATRYVTPLREGGSLPGLVEADDDGLYVVKFRGAGQGPKALAAEIVAGELARGLGLPVPDLVLVDLDPELARAEPDPEIQELIAASGDQPCWGPAIDTSFATRFARSVPAAYLSVQESSSTRSSACWSDSGSSGRAVSRWTTERK